MARSTEAGSFYDVLGVNQTAAPEAVRKAYKCLILETHPDKLSLEATEAERELGEARFREVHAAFEVLSDPVKRRQYDMGLNFVRRTERQAEMSAKLARERRAWEAEQHRRREERLRRMREQQLARQERMRQTAETMRQQAANSKALYEQQRTYEQELCRSYQKNQERIIQAGLQRLERLRILEEELRSRRREPQRIEVNIHMTRATKVQVKKPDEFLEELRKMNPEWERRREAILRRRAESTNSQESISSQGSTDSPDSATSQESVSSRESMNSQESMNGQEFMSGWDSATIQGSTDDKEPIPANDQEPTNSHSVHSLDSMPSDSNSVTSQDPS